MLANRYGDRTHFIYELLQNTEDALGRRTNWDGSRGVSFDLDSRGLRVSHFGVPFDEDDVRGVCGIDEGTKNLTEIGRFGIGFKSVFAFTDRPEIHSGTEAFAIESFVLPAAVDPVQRGKDETVIIIPFLESDNAGKNEIADALSGLGTASLLFLQEIEEIRWSVDGVPTGLYLRDAVPKASDVRRVNIIGQKSGEAEIDDSWLVFSRPVRTEGGVLGGNVEVAWWTEQSDEGRSTIRPVKRSPLVVFFPTVVTTYLGFLIQGPYRTTPSRDNVPESDEWNRMCIEETGVLIVDSLKWLRDKELLDVTALACLPIQSHRFEETMFDPLLETTKCALMNEELLPAVGGGYASGQHSRLARTEELRELVLPTQLAELDGHSGELHWLDRTISQNRTPQLYEFLNRELGIREFTPITLLQRLTTTFLEAQSDDWIASLYQFLGTQRALRGRVRSTPIVRLADGSHVPPWVDDEPQAFLPGPVETGFSTVRTAVCQTEEAREFLESIGLAEPDPVDDVIQNVLPKYSDERVEYSETEYSADVNSLLDAAKADSISHLEKLFEALRHTPWVRAIDGTGSFGLWAKPAELYLATDRLRKLFRGIAEVQFVDNDVACLRGEEVRNLLERAGASRNLRTVEVDCDLSANELTEIRRNNGLEPISWGRPADKSIWGLDALLDMLVTLEPAERCQRSSDLWDALIDLHERRGARAFDATYIWGWHSQDKRASFHSVFVRMLNKQSWVADSSGELRPPGAVIFEGTDWRPNSFLQQRISFKPPALLLLAREVGIEPEVLDLLREFGVTSEAELRARLGINQDAEEMEQTQETDSDQQRLRERRAMSSDGEMSNGGGSEDGTDTYGIQAERPPPETVPPRQFYSYVSVVPDNEGDVDPDGLGHAGRMDLERLAIEFILDNEPDWQRTEVNNPGFDLYRGSTIDAATHWCEVKAMTGSLDDRPVVISRTQFELAQDSGDAYWLYVVERAGGDDPHLVRIHDPVGKAQKFTFDRGWRSVADGGPERSFDPGVS